MHSKKLSDRIKKTEGYKRILVSPKNHTKLAEMTNKNMVYNDIITELLEIFENKNAIGSEQVLAGASTHPISSTKGKGVKPKPNG